MFLILILGTFAISFWASSRVKSNYRRYAQVGAASGVTGAQAAAEIMRRVGINDVEIVAQPGELTDHYDPRHKRLVLSEQNFHGRSLAAVGIAAHEAGHAIQHAKAYAPLNLRMASVGITGIASQAVLWLPLIGMVLFGMPYLAAMWIMAAGWGMIMLFNLITLPVEFDASDRARKMLLSTGIVREGEEANGVSKMLNAAALTYVAAFLTSLAYFLWYFLPLLVGRRNDG
jgi:uncharacterized protein